MSNKLTALTAATLPLAGTEAFYVVQGGNSRQTTAGAVIASCSIIANNETITGTKTYNSGKLQLAGSTSGITILNAMAIASGTLTLPAATDTLVGRNTTDTLTNKTFDTAGVGNSLLINGLAATANTGTGAVVRATSPVLVTPALGTPTSGVATNLTFTPAGTGAVSRTIPSKFGDVVSVMDFGALGNNVQEDGVKFQAAINALPSSGGTIIVPPGTYLLNTTPTVGTKSVQWNIDAGATFTGTVGGTNVQGTSWPRAATNYTLVPFGVFSQVQTSAPLTAQASASGLFEALQPSTYNGNSVAVYAGASGSSTSGNVWAINALINAGAGAGGTYQAIEVDVDSFSAGALIKGIGISGVGTQTADVALEIQHGVGFDRGIDILNSTIGMQIRTTCATALSIYNPGATGVGGAINAKQLANGNETITLYRQTDTSPTGNFLRFRNAADNANLFSVDISGGVHGGTLYPGSGSFTASTAKIYLDATLGAVITAGVGSVTDFGLFNAAGSELLANPTGTATLRMGASAGVLVGASPTGGDKGTGTINVSGNYYLNGSPLAPAPVTKTANFTVATTENQIIINQAATTTVTLPTASSFSGRTIRIKTIQAQTVVSASSNVVPLAGGAAGTAILAATAGKWADLTSDGTNWIIMASN